MTLKTGMVGTDGQEEVLSEYICDWPDCPDFGEHVVGVVVELRTVCVLCPAHAAQLKKRSPRS